MFEEVFSIKIKKAIKEAGLTQENFAKNLSTDIRTACCATAAAIVTSEPQSILLNLIHIFMGMTILGFHLSME
jgi:hypothetical protein